MMISPRGSIVWRHARFVGDDLLGAKRDARGFFSRQRQGFVVRIGVQNWVPAKHRSHSLQKCDAGNVVHGLLRR